jgi:hypothetical protein
MLIIQRLTPYWTTLAIAVTFWFGISNPNYWLGVATALVLIVVGAVLILRQPQWAISPIILLLSAYTFSLIQESAWLIWLVTGVTVIVYALLMKNVTVFVCQPARYIPYSLQHISTYTNVLSSFFFYVSIFIFYILQITHLRYLLAMTVVVTALLVWQTVWSQKIAWQRSWMFVIYMTLVMTEMVWLLHFWPVSFFVSGLTLTLAFYVLLHLSRHQLTETLTRTVAWRYVIISGLALTLLYGSASWL